MKSNARHWLISLVCVWSKRASPSAELPPARARRIVRAIEENSSRPETPDSPAPGKLGWTQTGKGGGHEVNAQSHAVRCGEV